jgi:hypothetical protein
VDHRRRRTGDEPTTTTALTKVLDAIPGSREILVGLAVGAVADALLSTDPDAVGAALAGGGWAEPFTATELTPAIAAGTLDSCEQQKIYVVRIVASSGDCEFCEGYDGRILHLDETSGMPPLHRGCSCDIEPLD